MAKADVIVCGHSHVPFLRKVGPWRFINPGSVGRPDDGDPRASYAVAEFRRGALAVRHYRVAYDAERTAQRSRELCLPESFARMVARGALARERAALGGSAGRDAGLRAGRRRCGRAAGRGAPPPGGLPLRRCAHPSRHPARAAPVRRARAASPSRRAGAVLAALRGAAPRHRLDRGPKRASQGVAADDPHGGGAAVRAARARDHRLRRALPSSRAALGAPRGVRRARSGGPAHGAPAGGHPARGGWPGPHASGAGAGRSPAPSVPPEPARPATGNSCR